MAEINREGGQPGSHIGTGTSTVSAQPIFSILQRALARSNLSTAFHRSINEYHRRITVAIGAGDADDAGEQMRRHLEQLHPEYQRVWRRTARTGRIG